MTRRQEAIDLAVQLGTGEIALADLTPKQRGPVLRQFARGSWTAVRSKPRQRPKGSFTRELHRFIGLTWVERGRGQRKVPPAVAKMRAEAGL